MTAAADRIVSEALAKSGLLWITSPAGSSPVWHAQIDGVAYVVSGEGEQFMPEHLGPVQVVTRSKDTRARLASFEAEASVASPDDDDWDAAVAALVAGRLNAPTGDTATRWTSNNRITRITPDLATVMVRGQVLPGPDRPKSDEPKSDEEPTTPVVTSPENTSEEPS